MLSDSSWSKIIDIVLSWPPIEKTAADSTGQSEKSTAAIDTESTEAERLADDTPTRHTGQNEGGGHEPKR